MSNSPYLPNPVPDLDGWEQRGVCRSVDPDLFFPADGERAGPKIKRVVAAAAVCAGCPVRGRCLEQGIARGESGVWGGVLLNAGHPDPYAQASTVPARLQPCGTHAAYRRHIRRKEPACTPCREAYNTHRAGRGPGVEVQPCGTPAAYWRHLRHEEKPCEPCKAASRRHNADRAARNAS